MELYELQPLIKDAYKKNKESWEQTRLLGYIIALTQSTKKLKMTDVLTFPWDEEEKEEKGDTGISKADIERLRHLAEMFNKTTNE